MCSTVPGKVNPGKMSDKEVLLFVSRESATYQFTIRQVEGVCAKTHESEGPYRFKLIHIEDDPEAAERYNIEALPTLIIGHRRFVGTPTAESINTLVAMMMADAASPENIEKKA